MGGTVGCFKLLRTTSGEITLVESQSPLKFSGSGPCKERQESSHPHQVYLVSDPSHRGDQNATKEVLVPDLGSDQIHRLSKDSSGKWAVVDSILFSKYPGGGPRHVIVKGTICMIYQLFSCSFLARLFRLKTLHLA